MHLEDKHFERSSATSNDSVLAGKPLLNQDENASLERQQKLQMAKTFRLTKDETNSFRIDLGNGKDVEDFRGFASVPTKALAISDKLPDELSTRNVEKDSSDVADKSQIRRSGYNNAEEAAAAFAQEVNPSSQLQHCEYGSAIYFDAETKTYGYTEPKRFPMPGEEGYDKNRDPGGAAPSGIDEIPPGTKAYGRLHTHIKPDNNYGTLPLEEDHGTVSGVVLGKNAAMFNQETANGASTRDKDNADRQHFFSYVVAPDGHTYKYDPTTHRTSDVTTKVSK